MEVPSFFTFFTHLYVTMINHMNQPIVLSMDLASNSKHTYAIKDGPASTIATGTTSSSTDALEQMIQEVPDRTDRELAVVIEATGMAWFPIALFFENREATVYRVKAQKSEKFGKFLDQYCKTDRLDTQALGRLFYVVPDQLHEVWLPLGELKNMRRWCKRRETYVQQRADDKRRLKGIIKWALPDLAGRAGQCSGKNMREIIAHAVDYKWTCTDMGEKRFKQWARKRYPSISDDQLDAIFEAAEDAQANGQDTDYDPRAVQEEALDIVEHLRYLDEKIEQIEEKMQHNYQEVLPDKPVDSAPGIGWKTEAVVKSYLGDGSRFANLSKAQAFMGMIPETDQSGDTDRQGTDIRKDGPPLLKKFMYMAADTARLWDPQIAQTYHDQMVNKGKTHQQALCKCANKLLNRVMRILDDGREYELRDNDGQPVEKETAREIIQANYEVPENIRRNRRDQAV